MKKTLITLLGIVLCGAAVAVEKPAGATMEQYVDALMRRMTLEEKIGQLNLPSAGDITTGQAKSSDIAEKIRRGEVGGLFNIKGVEKIRDVQRIAVEESRLGIPLIFGMDVIHGYETTFPIPLGLTATWDMEAVERAARISAVEASAAGICWTFSPMVDIARDPRWGRASEGIGEDPFLGSAVARSFVYGYQGRDPMHFATDEIMGCVKHYALYGAAEAGRDYNTTDMSRQRMYNEYFPPYKAAVEAGVGSVMASFNEVDGIPATANRWLMTTVLREQWGFEGFVVTDYTGIYEMIAHGLGDLKEVSARAVEAGVDMDMVSEGYLGTLQQSLEEGRIPLSDIDRACRLVLEAKFKLGLFDDPYRYCDPQRAATQIYTPAHRAEARRIAGESFVLLKNEGDVLFGDVNPSGKLPATFPRSVGQIPLFYNHKNTGRPLLGDKFEKFRSNYLDVPNTPLYPFGYGLSYTTFDYGDVRLSASEMTADGSIEATVRLTNSGRRDGVEVVQLYIRDRVGSSTRPVQELKGFQRVALKAGESRDVSFTIDVSLLKYYDFDLRYVAEPGEFDVMIGGASDAVKQASFTLK